MHTPNLHQHLVESIPAGIFHTGVDGRCKYVNSAWLNIFELTLEDALGDGWAEAIHPDDRDRVFNSWNQAVTNLDCFELECRLLLKDNLVRFIKARANPILEDEKIIGYVGYVEDISQNKATEAKLNNFEILASSILEQSPVAQMIINHQDEITYLNPAFIHLLGYTQIDIPNQAAWFSKAFPSKQQKNEAIKKWQAFVSQPKISYELNSLINVNILCANQDIKNMLVLPTLLKGNLEAKFAISFFDRTEQKSIQLLLNDSQERFELAVNNSGSGIWDWNIITGESFYSTQYKKELGYQEDEFPNNIDTFYAHIHPDDKQQVTDAIKHHIGSDNTPYKVHYRLRRKDGTYQWYESIGKALKNENGVAYRMAGSHKNITEQRSTQIQLAQANLVFENSSEAILITNANGIVEAINPAFSLLSGYEKREIIGKDYKLVESEKNDRELIAEIHSALRSRGSWSGHCWCKQQNGTHISIAIIINRINAHETKNIKFIALFSDITEQKQTQELIWKQAHYDGLTQLLNRTSFNKLLKQTIQAKAPFTLLFIDLDHFKQVNDTLGHNVGDNLLKLAAARIQHCIRNTDACARFGGDEFTVILSGMTNHDGIERICTEIIHHLAEPYPLEKEQIYISASIGISQFPIDSDDSESLFKFADQAMYDAKRLGRNRFSFFTQDMQDLAIKQKEIGADLRSALEKNQFELLYQPIIDLNSNHIYKAEALIRWHHPEKGLISPADFIPIAEETGLIVELGNWVFRQAAMQSKVWRKHYHPDFQVSINKSPVQFYNNQSHQNEWHDFMKTINLDGSGITVEITEGLLLDGITVVKDKLEDYHSSGMNISLDDFGTGYSALSYLKKFDIDFIKIDQSFVKNIEHDAYDLVLCETIISMSHKLGKKVIAEGIETQAQKEFLMSCHCDYGQGYLFSKPVTATQLTQLLQKQITAK